MKLSEKWLRGKINPPISTTELSEQLIMAGLEVSSIVPIGENFSNIVVGEIISVMDHPNAKKLHVCQVKASENEILEIVCGADNVRTGLKVALAKVGAVLPNGQEIKAAELRGVLSSGMLCSLKELALSDFNEVGILELPSDATVGLLLTEYMELPDQILEIELTPNRSDCLSINGLAREIAAINQLSFEPSQPNACLVQISEVIKVEIKNPEYCPKYLGRVIKGITPQASSPMWLQETLRRSGIRSIHPIVDITNFVMLELGQPMHAFDLKQIDSEINIRLAKPGEFLKLLDNSKITLTEKDLVIADLHKVLALAGIMGGASSGVEALTTDIFLESAYFEPTNLSLTARAIDKQTDSSYRFARGVDFEIQREALERATQLIVNILGGEVGPIIEKIYEKHLPQSNKIHLRHERIGKLLGFQINKPGIEKILKSLNLKINPSDFGWEVNVPTYRFDLNLEEDLIEEIARIYGYQNIVSQVPKFTLNTPDLSETRISRQRLAKLLIDNGYQEIITYSFVDESIQKIICDEKKGIKLSNPISSDLSIMRTSLWPGLIQAACYNLNRQINRIRLFEIGMCFWETAAGLHQEMMLGGIVSGGVSPLQWAATEKNVDFYDVKGDLETLLELSHSPLELKWVKSTYSALHPGQQAEIKLENKIIGRLGLIHPLIFSKLGLPPTTYLFEFNLEALQKAKTPNFNIISKLPSIRRDLAIIVEENIPSDEILNHIRGLVKERITDITIFDIYQGDKIEKGHKSIAFSLTFQEISRTLTDTEINDIMGNILQELEKCFKAKLRV